MNKKITIKRKKRFYENTTLESYTGIIFVSSFLPKENNAKKPLRLNITNFYLYRNNFCLLDKFINENELKKILINNYSIKKNKLISINKIFTRGPKVIYLVYLDHDVKINNFTKFTTLNIFKKKDYTDPKTNDLYLAVYNNNKHLKFNKYKILFDRNNYIETSINTIFYYLIGNYSII